MLRDITPVVLTLNEAPNLARVLERLRWAGEVIVCDSGSTDETEAIARGFPNVRWMMRPFDDHASQWNHAVAAARTAWVMCLDADYVLPPELVAEIEGLADDSMTAGYDIAFRYLIDGVPLRASLYPPLTVLFRRVLGRYRPHGHRMVLELDGPTKPLRSLIDHDDRKDPGRWMRSQRRYAVLEAARLRSTKWSLLRNRDRMRRAVLLTPWLVPLYCLFVLGLWRDGRAGWRYVRERATAEWLIARELMAPSR